MSRKGFSNRFDFSFGEDESFTSHGDSRIIYKQSRYIYDTSIFPFLGSFTETTSTVLPCALVKQSDQDEGTHEMTAMSCKLGGSSFTKVYIAEVPSSLPSLSVNEPHFCLNSNQTEDTF